MILKEIHDFAVGMLKVNGVIVPTKDETKGFVNHGATAGTARPTGFTSVEWYGSVAPTNAVTGDTWIDTST